MPGKRAVLSYVRKSSILYFPLQLTINYVEGTTQVLQGSAEMDIVFLQAVRLLLNIASGKTDSGRLSLHVRSRRRGVADINCHA